MKGIEASEVPSREGGLSGLQREQRPWFADTLGSPPRPVSLISSLLNSDGRSLFSILPIRIYLPINQFLRRHHETASLIQPLWTVTNSPIQSPTHTAHLLRLSASLSLYYCCVALQKRSKCHPSPKILTIILIFLVELAKVYSIYIRIYIRKLSPNHTHSTQSDPLTPRILAWQRLQAGAKNSS